MPIRQIMIYSSLHLDSLRRRSLPMFLRLVETDQAEEGFVLARRP